MTDSVTNTPKPIEDTISTTTAKMDSFVKAQQAQIEKTSTQFIKSYDELTTLAKGNVDAVVEAGTIVAKGAEEAGRQVASYTQSAFELHVAATKSMLGVKSLQELLALQNSYAKSSLDALIGETTKLQELAVKVTSDAMAPLNARINLAVEKLAKPLAA